MKTVKATCKANPEISYLCPECGHFNRYSKFGAKPELVECANCNCGLVPIWREES